MESYEIYEDLAPFNGDLFKLDAPVEFEPFGFEPNFNDSLLKPSQNGAQKVSDTCGSPTASESDAVIGGPYDQSWLDTQVDIQQILQCQVADTGLNVETEYQVPNIPEQPAAPNNGFTITEYDLQVLHIPEEQAITQLQTSSTGSFDLSCGTEASVNTSLDSMSLENDVDFQDFVPLMDEPIDDLELEHYMSSETILSPMSPEDIESILSVSPIPQETNLNENLIDNKDSSQIITIDLSQLHPSITSELQKCLLGSVSISDDQEFEDIAMPSPSNSSVRHSPYETPKRKGGRKPVEKKTRKKKKVPTATLR